MCLKSVMATKMYYFRTARFICFAAPSAMIRMSVSLVAHRLAVAILLTVTLASAVFAQVPRTISYQGLLETSKGIAVPDGQHLITVNLYATRTGKIVLYTKEDSVTTHNGFFSVML